MTDFTCAEFRRRRDAFQRERQKAALPVLKEKLATVTIAIKALKANRGERMNMGLEEDLKALQFDKQYLQGQIDAIKGV